MLICMDRVRDKSGNIIAYVFDDGSVVKAEKVKKELLKQGTGFIANLVLTSDNKILYKEVIGGKADKEKALKGIAQGVLEQEKLTLGDFKLLRDNIHKYLSFRLVELNTIEDSNIYTSLAIFGPYIMQVEYRWNVNSSNWSILIFDGNYKRDECVLFSILSIRPLSASTLKDKLDKLSESAKTKFDLHSGIYSMENLLLTNFNKLFRHKSRGILLDGVFRYRIKVEIARANVDFISLYICNYSPDTTGKDYKITLNILGKTVKLGTTVLKRYVAKEVLQQELIQIIRNTVMDEVYERIKKDEYSIRKLLDYASDNNKMIVDLLGYENF